VIKGHISINSDITNQKNTEKRLERSYNILNSIVENITDHMNEVLEYVKINLEILIKENDTIITDDPLPNVKAEKTQMFELLQNLITNSIKYRSLKTPHIHISAGKDGSN